MILLVGQYSTGKTTFIRHLLEQVRYHIYHYVYIIHFLKDISICIFLILLFVRNTSQKGANRTDETDMGFAC